MTKKDDMNKKDLNVFNQTFQDLLKDNESTEETKEQPTSDAPPPTHEDGNIQDIMFDTPDIPHTDMTEDQMLEFPDDFVPRHADSESWEEYAERAPMIPLSREQEARAVSIGLQEIRKMKEFMIHSFHHLTNEFNRVYAVYPILFTKDIAESYDEAHKKIYLVMDDIEHLIAGDFDNLEAVKKDFSLTQAYDEKRQSVLHQILAYYDSKN